jgi:23S rRNA G2445 N2-methylase RlmL
MRRLAVPAGNSLTLILYVTKGLADVAEAEVTAIAPAATVSARSDRFLILDASTADAERLGALVRTVDDIRLLVAGPIRIGSQPEFGALCESAADATAAALLSPGNEWSVTMSARHPPWRAKPAWDPAPIIAKHLRGADPAATLRHPVDLRIQVDEDMAHIAVSLWESPVGKHPGEPRTTWHGALRPTVAAALVRLGLAHTDPTAAARGLYDPFCGSGTIAAEAARAGLPVFASDVSPEAVSLTRERLAVWAASSGRPGFGPGDLLRRVFVCDVRQAPDPRVSARLLVGNMPWGKQVKVDGRLALFDATARLAAHTTRSGGTVVLLTTHEDQLAPRLRRHGLTATTRRIGLLGQTPAIVLAHPA